MKLVSLKASNVYAEEKDDATNTIDFTKMIGVEHHLQRELVRPTPSLTGCAPPRHADMGMGLYRFSNATNPVFIFVSADDRSSVCARFFCTRFVHYFRWKGESIQFYVASANFHDHKPACFDAQREAWREHNRRCIDAAVNYFTSDPKLGFVATPVAFIYTDCRAKSTREEILKLLPHDRPFLIRWLYFAEDWDTADEEMDRRIMVSLQRQALRVSRCSGSVVCSDMASFLNAMLPVLYQLYTKEPVDGAPSETLRSFPPVFFTRHGQSEYNVEDRLGGNSDLTDTGREDAEAIAYFFEHEVRTNERLFADRSVSWGENAAFEVWCSQLRRTQSTAQPTANILTEGVLKTLKSLNEIHAGICEDMTNDEIKLLYPFIQSFRHMDKVGFRYPDGESYVDLVRRLTPLLIDLNNCTKCVVVVAHQAVLRTVLSFFGGRPVEEAVHVPCPQRTVWVCTTNRLGEPQLAEITLSRRRKDEGETQARWEGW
ncbi:fructose-6-phosphate2-kinase/fructose-26-bisph os phatase-likeprotein [Leptomonas pyrrhocoris]|uniref:Fructose-6-phosphate2-kinase/fructose-26-bisph os phatase-likeprotein n=1 Tax=Leptomonas pyrrhocoris TaxID=157538 RepID=A0A0M9G0G1_LEPPY|nr:fructose-6-phosphate2-kinase/fructose-26-bisph os phatase-likeprotein [Leptomonas pyrrhocoris]XP_015658265.1 fructose-6-phosphate2-kinase/fructose-26-bisph os phatase-likeprotein [Leptomonas pyrrhocoris]KPA79825.1 fructose-6-phosphate2-kinase/fructose-26-bisph os phatase-likeprotein [Leptomonas pyrrhocoris]KPA79826.1 fructose-6-phosphate2-kinase/fructose-26-bisph os phatase-likeprotein [Leptomonas pyrrhocoris]|eukprot:XP_015658264.1 fructose-6-phosphate2-kinase/fructose-26-bisph os phatase-likeprotein [Leptomonas pyrrhocoris]